MRVGNLLIKLALQKAYDRMEWGIVRKVFPWFNFPQLWIELILSCHRFYVHTDQRSHHGIFLSSGDICQGDPLSPFSFLLMLWNIKPRNK